MFSISIVLQVLITAIIFGYLGWRTAVVRAMPTLVEKVIDQMIKDGYIKTRGKGEEMILLKHWED